MIPDPRDILLGKKNSFLPAWAEIIKKKNKI
jgi:hypothetical protein